MIQIVLEALRREPFSSAILCMYACNIFWQLAHRNWGLAWYWLAAAQITFVATWLMKWSG